MDENNYLELRHELLLSSMDRHGQLDVLEYCESHPDDPRAEGWSLRARKNVEEIKKQKENRKPLEKYDTKSEEYNWFYTDEEFDNKVIQISTDKIVKALRDNKPANEALATELMHRGRAFHRKKEYEKAQQDLKQLLDFGESSWSSSRLAEKALGEINKEMTKCS